MNYLTVDLYNDFQCIADACPNTCCSDNWTIIIDDKTRLKMIEKEKELGIPAKDWLIEKNGSTRVKSKNNKCPMLAENGLCNVVLKLGPQYLSETCQIYPRIQKQYGSFTEEYLVLSCPEVIAKLMEKETIDIYVSKDNRPTQDYPYNELYCFEVNVRTHIFNILRSKETTSLSVKLFLIFNVLNHSIQMYQNNQLDIDLFDNTCTKTSTLPYIETQLNGIISDRNRYDILKNIMNIFNSHSTNQRFYQCIYDAVQYFNKTNITQFISDVKKFKQNFCCSYQNFYINYWTYRIFTNMISIPDYEKSKEMILYFAVGFSLIQTISMVSFINDDGLSKKKYINIISYLDRILEHSHPFREQLISEIKRNDLISAAGLLIFIIS